MAYIAFFCKFRNVDLFAQTGIKLQSPLFAATKGFDNDFILS